METKKISFGFSKVNKKPNLLQTKGNVKTETKVELIKCLEGREIKLVEEKPVEKLLVIPLKEPQRTSAALASLMKRRAVLLDEEEPEKEVHSGETTISLNNEDSEDIEKRAARELLAEVQNRNSSHHSSNLVLPVVKPEDIPLEGAKESTLDDYESIPIEDFGKAMLRGMGWTEPPTKGEKKGVPSLDDIPVARPKGMGLGADKALKKKSLLVLPERNELLEIKRNAYVVILGGKHKDLYGQIEGFDDHSSRVIVKMAIGGSKEVFNEFLCQPVSRKEFAQYGKCINSSKYEEYKRKENQHSEIIIDKPDGHINEGNVKKELDDSRRYDYHKEDKRDIRRESDRNKDRVKHNIYKNEEKQRKEKPDVSDPRHVDVTDHKCEYNEWNYKKEGVQRKQEDTCDSESDNTSNIYKNHSSRHYYQSANRDLDKQHKRNRNEYAKRKAIKREDSSSSESDYHLSKHKKCKKKDNLEKKSKKFKKSKYKYDSPDDKRALSPRNLSSSEEEKHTKHKKRTKKSKRQRERSRSRGRR